MDISKIKVGKNAPEDINVVIEVPQGGAPIKYEFDKDSGAIEVDRFLHTPMRYPADYGFVPHTLCGDGDPADVLVVSPHPLVPGCVINARPVGVLVMEDESGEDEKIIAVPSTKIYPFYENVENHTDLPQILLDQIEHFFKHYKDLEKNKHVNIKGWGDAAKAKSLLQEAIARAGDNGGKAAA